MRDAANKKRLDRLYHRRKVEAGICTQCSRAPARDGRRTCESCGEAASRAAQGKYQECVEKGVCPRCRTAVINTVYCPDCIKKISRSPCRSPVRPLDPEKRQATQHRYRERLRQRVLDRYGRCCSSCNEERELALELDHIHDDGKVHAVKRAGSIYLDAFHEERDDIYQILCASCNWRKHLAVLKRKRSPHRTARNNRRSRARLRKLVIDVYGGACRGCGERDLDVLLMDHVQNDGHLHRRQVKASALYRWLRDNNYPEGFQVLCRNCNIVKARNDGVLVAPKVDGK